MVRKRLKKSLHLKVCRRLKIDIKKQELSLGEKNLVLKRFKANEIVEKIAVTSIRISQWRFILSVLAFISRSRINSSDAVKSDVPCIRTIR